MVNEETAKLVKDTHEKVNAIEQALRGYNGQPGLIKDHENLKKDYFKFKRLVLVIFAFAIGSGAIGLGIWRVLI